jgi:hypothetical protein
LVCEVGDFIVCGFDGGGCGGIETEGAGAFEAVGLEKEVWV